MNRLEFIDAFRSAATRLRTYEIAGQWMRLRDELPDLTAAEAAAWADLGFMPDEARVHIAAGISAATYRETEDHAAEQAGGGDALAAQRIRQMLDGGELVQGVRDPFDPDRTILP